MSCRVMANKWISRHRLLVDTAIKGNLQGLLERGVQELMDKEEIFDERCWKLPLDTPAPLGLPCGPRLGRTVTRYALVMA
jgi:hypothetical protein